MHYATAICEKVEALRGQGSVSHILSPSVSLLIVSLSAHSEAVDFCCLLSALCPVSHVVPSTGRLDAQYMFVQ